MPFSDDISNAIKALKKGGVIAYPTDTIWGLGCDIDNADAVEKIYTIKNRDRNKPIILLVSDIDMLVKYVKIHPRVETLLLYHFKPLTLIHKADRRIPKHLQSTERTIAIRIVQDDFCQKLIRKFGKPITSTSANIANEDFPKRYTDICSSVLRQTDYVVKYRQSDKKKGQPSIVAKYDKEGELIFLR